ncbi:MAG: hypothetical protein ACRDIL_09310, partial [Candidatus Limnocylindrales bacterium]
GRSRECEPVAARQPVSAGVLDGQPDRPGDGHATPGCHLTSDPTADAPTHHGADPAPDPDTEA